MAKQYNFNEAQSKPVLNSSGQAWCLNCMYCNKQIDMLKDSNQMKWLKVGQYIRHRKCAPPPIK